MEAYKYVTEEHLERINREGALVPRRADGRTYAIPDNPNLWGENMLEVFNHLMKRGVFPIVLLRFILDEQDVDVGVQEGGVPVWDKPDTRVWIGDYVRDDFKLPEVVIFRPILILSLIHI